jgi:hypothetical protein
LRKIYEFGEQHGCNANNFLNARFCSIKLKPIFQEVYRYIVPIT